MSPPKAKPVNPGQHAKLQKRVLEAAAMIDRLKEKIRELMEENATLREHCAKQDESRRTSETKHSEELTQILNAIKKLEPKS